MGSHQNPVQGAVVVRSAVVDALLHSAGDAGIGIAVLTAGIGVHKNASSSYRINARRTTRRAFIIAVNRLAYSGISAAAAGSSFGIILNSIKMLSKAFYSAEGALEFA